ncbi:hypothetical protein Thu_196 [Bacillus phage Thurquoise]|nr:hypothetical protein Thu_196 [Bacillus phage Thurquoise]
MNTNKLLGFGKTYGSSGGVFFTSIDVTDKPDYVGVMVKDKEEAELVTEVVCSYVAPSIRSKFLHLVDSHLLQEMLEMANDHKYIEVRVDFYDKEDDPMFCSKTEYEGVGYGDWGFLLQDDYEANIKSLRANVSRFVESTQKDLDNGVTIFALVTEYGENVMYHFIGRPRLNADVQFLFSDNKFRDYSI